MHFLYSVGRPRLGEGDFLGFLSGHFFARCSGVLAFFPALIGPKVYDSSSHCIRVAALLALLITLPTQAGVLTTQTGSTEIEKVKISTGGSATVEGQTTALTTVGSGLRYKKVAFIKAKVYVGELLVDDPAKFQRSIEGALSSIDHLKAIAIRLTMLRDVDAKKMMEAFQEGLKENGISLDKAEMKEFLAAVQSGAEAKEGKTATVLGLKLAEDKEAVIYEDCAGKATVMKGDKGFARTVFSIWLGKMNDSGLENLRSGLLGL